MRRRALAGAVTMLVRAGSLTAAFGAAAQAPATSPGASDMRSFVDALWPDAQARGIPRTLFDATFAGLTPDPSVAAMTRRQPEFVKPLGAYLAAQVTPARVAAGRAMMVRWQDDLAAIARRYAVPAAILVAVWGLETNYGASVGSKDVIRSLVTLAAMNYRPALYRAETLAALAMLRDGEVGREALRGSWAGAMGLPQFMPSSFESDAVDWNGDGRRDIWTSVPDALASIAHFIRSRGWQPDQMWGFPVRVPPGFDFGTSRAAYTAWSALGFRRVDGSPLPTAGDGILFFPAGATGPGFLVTPNFEVLKTYNFSDAYVLSIADLSGRIAGAEALPSSWPPTPPMTRENRIALQTRLVALGYPVDNREGRISLMLRDVIRTAQTRAGMLPDGNPTDALLRALQAVPATP